MPALLHRVFLTAALALGLLLMQAPAQAQAPAQKTAKTIKIGSMLWEDWQVVSLITKKLLEREGYQVEYRTFSEWGIAYAALQKGDIHLLASATEYMAADYWDRYKDRLEKVSTVSHGVFQGLVVPSYMDVNSVEDLNGVADQVKGRIIGTEPGSGLMRETAEAIKSYGLKYQLVDGSTAGMVAQLKSALERKEPIVTMLWTPSWMIQTFDVKFLADPKGVFAPPQSYSWLTRRGFLDDERRARELIASVYVPLGDVVDITGAMNTGKTVQQAVDAWWDAHATLVARWAVVSSK